MRKINVLLITVTIMLLAACGAGEKALTKTEVLSQAIEAVEKVESYSADMKIDTDAMGMAITIEGTGDITHHPDAFYMEMTMGMPGMSMETETYAVGEEVFMGMFGEWFIMSEEDLGLESFDQLNAEELDKLNEFDDQFEMTEEDNMYVLTLSGEGEEFAQLAETYVQSVMEDYSADLELEEEALNFSVNSLDMELQIDKETMLIMTQKVAANIEMDDETFQIDAEVTVSNVNEVGPIEIPDEIRENAVAEDDMDDAFSYEEESMTLEEIQEMVDYTVPQVSNVPEGFEMTDSYYDEFMDMAYFIYEKDLENGLILSVYPSIEAYDDIIMDEVAETVMIHDKEGTLETIEDDLFYLTWEHNDLFLELIGEGSEMTKDLLLEIAESVE